MKEAVAKTKFCPFARATGPSDSVSANRIVHDGEDIPLGHCIGSKCMAWIEDENDPTEGSCFLTTGGIV